GKTMKKVLALLLAVVLVFAMAACKNPNPGPATDDTTKAGSELAGTYDIVVWVADNIVELTKKQINDFNEKNEDGIKFNATVEPVGEGDAATNMITDVTAGGDIFCFAQDQFARLVNAGALAKLGQAAQKTVQDSNDADAVAAATSGSEMYAYPLTADNGYFMYYDKSVISDDIVDSLEDLIAACEDANKYFSMELGTSAWYLASFFFGTGCVSEWATDDDGNFTSINDTFNSANGLIAAKGMKKLLDSPIHNSSSDGSGFANNSAVLVSGTWAYETVKATLGDNMGVADLPSFTVDGKEYHMGSYMGFKLLGVKPQKDAVRAAAIHKLAQYLTSEEGQLERFQAVSWGPANLKAQENEEVKANPALTAVAQQKKYAVPQGQIHGSWWDIAKVIGDDVKAATDDAGLQAALDTYRAKIDALFAMDTSGYMLVGAWNGWNNADDAIRMQKDGDVYTLTISVEQSDYMGGRIVTPGNWDNDKGAAQVTTGKDLLAEGSFDAASNGDNNMIFANPGTYKVTFNEASKEITIEAQ
ncbi:MAG: extracellular solute-binding protein, partial [Lachnospiraceae bacterium]|nr:extracellular solute-binding protein [Lachnospiraceae bacterium]